MLPHCVKNMTNSFPTRNKHRVVALAYDGLCTFEFGITVEIFALPRPEVGDNWYQFKIAALDNQPINAMGGLQLAVQGSLALFEQADTIIIPGWSGIDIPVPDTLCRALNNAAQRGARIVSICSGVFVLAAAGLLNGRQATTHWRYSQRLAQRYPQINVQPDVLYIDNGNIMTSAGSAAGIDLCLHIVRRDFGAAAANKVARRLVVQPHRQGGQAQYIDQAVPLCYESDRFAPLFDYLYRHLCEDHTPSSLAKQVNMAERTFLRRFKGATGMTPGQWLLNARLKYSCDLLENSHENIEVIAEKSGFGSAATLRHHFRKILMTSPAAYRKSFTLHKT